MDGVERLESMAFDHRTRPAHDFRHGHPQVRGPLCAKATADPCQVTTGQGTVLSTSGERGERLNIGNAAERPLRPAVLWRRKSFGTHSAAGSRFAECLLTVAVTLKTQQRNIVDYVTQACVAALHRGPRSITPASTLAHVRSSLNAYEWQTE